MSQQSTQSTHPTPLDRAKELVDRLNDRNSDFLDIDSILLRQMERDAETNKQTI